MMHRSVCLSIFCLAVCCLGIRGDDLPEIQAKIILKHDDGVFLWFHPRAAAIPGDAKGDSPTMILTLQKHLRVSDYYSGLYFMRSDDLGKTWTEPVLPKELDWGVDDSGATIAVCDVTPGWHAPTKRLLAIGTKVRYSKTGKQLHDQPQSHQASYSVYDPKTNRWTTWSHLQLLGQKGTEQYSAAAGCCQWIVEPDGSILIPLYVKDSESVPFSTVVVRCQFDGKELTVDEVGERIELSEPRGIYEPSIAKLGGRYFLTLRNDVRGYVATSKDGLHYEPCKPWKFDDGEGLGSYNTQQHWLTHGDELYLAYTRKGADNDHIFRHRAPLFIARVDPEKLVVIRETEQVLVPERGATLGNFGANAVTDDESWVTVAEGVFHEGARERGAEGAVWMTRVLWK